MDYICKEQYNIILNTLQSQYETIYVRPNKGDELQKIHYDGEIYRIDKHGKRIVIRSEIDIETKNKT